MTDSLLSPVCKLPFEILGEIFLHYVKDNSDPEALFDIPVLQLTHVCRSWQEVAVTFKTLWSNIVLNLNGSGQGSGLELRRDHALFLEMLITRSGGQVFDFSVHDSKCTLTADGASMISPILRRHAHRCRTLTVPVLVFTVIPDELQVSWPRLRALSISSLETPSSTEIVRFLGSAPGLYTVMCIGEMNLLLPWARVIHLHLALLSPAHAMEIISCCPSLQRVDLSLLLICLPYTEVPHITSPLRHLSLRLDPRDDYETLSLLFDALTLPDLSSISFTPYIPGTPRGCIKWPMEKLSAFLARSACLITVLRIENLFHIHDLIQILKSMPSVVTLSIDCANSLSALDFTALIHSMDTQIDRLEDSQTVLPHLRHFHLVVGEGQHRDGADGPDYESLIDMIDSRWNSGYPCNDAARLESVRIRQIKPWDASDSSGLMESVRTLKNLGLDICLEAVDQVESPSYLTFTI